MGPTPGPTWPHRDFCPPPPTASPPPGRRHRTKPFRMDDLFFQPHPPDPGPRGARPPHGGDPHAHDPSLREWSSQGQNSRGQNSRGQNSQGQSSPGGDGPGPAAAGAEDLEGDAVRRLPAQPDGPRRPGVAGRDVSAPEAHVTQRGARGLQRGAARGRRGRAADPSTGMLFPDAERPAHGQESSGGPRPPLEPSTADQRASLRGALQCSVSPEHYLTWFRRSRLIGFEGKVGILAVPNTFAEEWIDRYYGDALDRCLAAVAGEGFRIELRVSPESLVEEDALLGVAEEQVEGGTAEADERPGAATPPAAAPPTPSAGPSGSTGVFDRPARPALAAGPASAPHGMTPPGTLPQGAVLRGPMLEDGSDLVLNHKCTFDRFVVGPCNRFGHAAVVGAAEQPGNSYNPLFLHGPVGVGKTHLLQAFCHSILGRYPGCRILYLSCETFVNHFIAALENGSTQSFRDKYRSIDVLVVDDVQILANKEKTQEEFFHTFNSLYNAGKQIVLSSDSPPKEIPTLQDRLISRFKWGMVTELQPPCLETRMAIVVRKAKERGVVLADDIVEFIAENIEQNVREIEGAVTRLFAYTSLSGDELTLETARQALAGLIDVRTTAPTVDDIVSMVTEHYGVKLSELQSRRRTKTIVFPRQVAMYLARKVTRHSLEEIGGFFGGRDHTTVLHAVEKIEKLLAADPAFERETRRFLERLADPRRGNG